MEVEMKWEFLEEKASETLSTDATSSCNFSDAFVSIYLQSKWSTLSPISSVGGRHEFTHSLSESVGLDEGAIIHNLWWSCMKEGTHLLLPVLPQSSSDRRSVQQVSTTTFPSLSDRIMHPNFLQSPFFHWIFLFFLFDQVHRPLVLDRSPPNSVLFCFWFWFVLHCMLLRILTIIACEYNNNNNGDRCGVNKLGWNHLQLEGVTWIVISCKELASAGLHPSQCAATKLAAI